MRAPSDSLSAEFALSLTRWVLLTLLLVLLLLCVLPQADPETDEVYAEMTLQPVSKVGQQLH